MALAAVASAADGIIVEVHNDSEAALSDGEQAMLPEKFEQIVKQMRAGNVADRRFRMIAKNEVVCFLWRYLSD